MNGKKKPKSPPSKTEGGGAPEIKIGPAFYVRATRPSLFCGAYTLSLVCFPKFFTMASSITT